MPMTDLATVLLALAYLVIVLVVMTVLADQPVIDRWDALFATVLVAIAWAVITLAVIVASIVLGAIP